MTKILWGINVPYQSQCINWEKSGDNRLDHPLVYDPCIRTHKEMYFVLCDICGSQVPPGRASRGITTCCPKCNARKWDARNGLIIQQEKNACGVRPTAFWQTISGECFTRDKWTCQHCKKTREQLEQDRVSERHSPKYKPGDYILNCHHIKPIKMGGNNHLDNLITLCGRCHKEEHSHTRNVARKHRPLITED